MRLLLIIILLTGNAFAAEAPKQQSKDLQILELKLINAELYRQVLELTHEKNQRLLDEIKVDYEKKKAEEEKSTKK